MKELKTYVTLLMYAMLFIGCATTGSNKTAKFTGDEKFIMFHGVPVPVSDQQKRDILASEYVTINGKTYTIGYHTIMRSGDTVGSGVYAKILDQDGNPVVEADGSEFISNSNDFSSLLPIGNELYSVSHLESRPGAMYLTKLNQDPATGKITAVSTQNVDFSQWHGLWVPCAGSVTPWNTHLGSEEYPPDGRAIAEVTSMSDVDDYWKPMARYFGIKDPFSDSVSIDEFKAVFNPYFWGFATEVAVKKGGSYEVTKHYAMGRADM